MKRRGKLWLLAAALLVALAALLMWTEKPKGRSGKVVEFPSSLRAAEYARLANRKRMLTLLAATADGTKAQSAPRDPFLVALSGSAARASSMVFEVAALADTPIGRMIVDCLEKRPDNPFAEAKKETGLDVLRDVERIAVADDLFVIGGDFAELLEGSVFSGFEKTTRGHATVFTSKDGKTDFALWEGELMLGARGPEALEEALGLLEGEIPFDEDVLPESETYGEIYGTLSIDEAAEVLEGNSDLAGRLAEAADEVKIHVDASSDVAMVAEILGGEPTAAADLARAMGGAMSVARMNAIAEGEDALAELLDFASVGRKGDGITAELALPLEFLERHLGDCGWMDD